MTDSFPNRHSASRIPARGFYARKFTRLLSLLLFGVLVRSAVAQTPLTYNDGDLFLGFRATDGTSDYLVNIGPPAQFVNATPGSTFQVDVGSTSADLTVAFGATWFTRIDPNTGRNAVLWAVTGGRQFAAAGDPDNTLYSTNPLAAPWPRHSDTAQGFTTSLVATMGNAFAGNLSTVNNPHGFIQSALSNNSYASFQPGGAHSGGISFQTWNPWNEAGPPISLFFDRITPGSGDSILLGTLMLNSSGQLSFTATGSSPTPTPTATPSITPTPTPTTPTPSPTPSETPTTPTPSPTPSETPTTPTPSPTPSTTPTTPTPSPSPTVSPTPSITPTTLGNISTRLRVETGDNALIGGFIVTGLQPKKIIVRAIGPSLASSFPGALADPILELRDSAGLIMSNDNWRTSQEAEIIATGVAPTDDLESAIVATLPANGAAYTVIVRGVNNGIGIGVVEAYDLDQTVDSKLANISTRGLVQAGDDAMIAGTIVLGPAAQRVLVRGIGPSLPVSGALADPMLELRDANGMLIRANDNWRSDPAQEAEIIATGIPPTSALESALVETLPGNSAGYTAILRGVNGTSGVALVEVYGLN